MRTNAILACLACGLLPPALCPGAGIPAVSPLPRARSSPDCKVALWVPAMFNASGNFLVGFANATRDSDVLREFSASGATVWECSVRPAGAVVRFSRGADGVTLVAQHFQGRYGRIMRIGRRGECLGGVKLSGSDDDAVRVETLQALPGGSIFASVRGYAFEASPSGSVTGELIHNSLRSAIKLSDGSLLCALTSPSRFSVYDRTSAAFKVIPLDALCHIWAVERAEEISQDLFRFYGCFCMSTAGGPGQKIERKTIEVIEIGRSGTISWAYGSPHALRVDEFGTQSCVTYTRQVIRDSSGRTILLDAYPENCDLAETNETGAVSRIIFSAPTLATEATIGLRACSLTGAQLLDWSQTAASPTSQ